MSKYTNAPVDLKEVLTKIDGDKALLRDLMDTFAAICNNEINKIEEAIRNKDSEALEKSAHKFKGSVANFGASAVLESAIQLEYCGKRSMFESAQVLLEMLKTEIKAFVQYFTEVDLDSFDFEKAN